MKGWGLLLSLLALLVGCAKHPAPIIEHVLPWYKDMPAADSEDIDSSRDVAKVTPELPYHPPVIYFGFNSDSLRVNEWKQLLDLAINLKGDCVVEGYASPEGDAAYNLALGHRRAKQVYDYLEISQASASLDLISYGAEKTVDNGDPERYALDRRVEVACQ